MGRALLIVAALVLSAAAALPVKAQTAAEQRQLDWVLERGRLLFALDRAAWVGTDDMFAQIPEAQRDGIEGYIVDKDEEGFVTIFYATEGTRLVAAYRGRVGPNGILSREVFGSGQRPQLTARQQRLAKTIGQFMEATPTVTTCSERRPNFAVIPPETIDDPVDLYVMTPQTEDDQLPVGGHTRFTLDRDGKLLRHRKFTTTCIAVSTAHSGEAEEQLTGLVVTHLLDPIPTEIHVFTALAAGLPVFVGTHDPERVWEVTGKGIRLMDLDLGI